MCYESEVYPPPGLEPGALDPEASILHVYKPMRPLCLLHCGEVKIRENIWTACQNKKVALVKRWPLWRFDCMSHQIYHQPVIAQS